MMGNRKRRRFLAQTRSALAWSFLFFFALHGAIGFYLHRKHPEFFDPEVTLRLHRLPARLAEAPGRPLALALGSSRLVMGLRPESAMAQIDTQEDKPILFNFSMLGAGPVAQRLILHRLLQQGIHPKWLILEVWPPILAQGFPFFEEITTFRHDIYWSDVSIIDRLYHRRWDAFGQVIAETLMPLRHYRETILNHYAPSLVNAVFRQAFDGGLENNLQYRLDDFGWVGFDLSTNPIHLERATRFAKPHFDCFHIDEVAEKAMHELLAECRQHDIQVIVLMMPDHSLIRSWYPPMQERLFAYLQKLCEDYGASLIDTRTWQADEDFTDFIHLSPKGAHAFSERFGREVYRLLKYGRPLGENVRLCGYAQPQKE